MEGFKILLPNSKPHFAELAELFNSLYRAVTGKSAEIIAVDDHVSNLVTFGSDAENILAFELIMEGVFDRFQLRTGTDDYHILSVKQQERNILFLASGNIRSAFYALYDFFEHAAGCHYFWDGDVIPRKEQIDIANWNIAESPRFEYRGLRYFAHRSLDRFQAEQWDWEDWKKEFDWILKKRLNLAMLRIGLDDLFQRAFPEEVPYPALDEHLPESVRHSYNDRDQFWSLKYRGELRQKVLAYGRFHGIFQPEDCGAPTHWYSRTPHSFIDKVKPEFMPQTDKHYLESDSGKVWDLRKDRNLDLYFQLLETSIREYGSPEMFHTIGVAERNCYPDRERNHKMKLYYYRRIIAKLREKYPHAPLLIASWDFYSYWKPEEVRDLLRELDPANTIIFDYTSDKAGWYNTFRDWGVVGKFPWIYGIFQAYESSSELHGQFPKIEERFPIAAADPFCKGVVYWPENSHQDTLMLDYFPAIAWNPNCYRIAEFLPGFCERRYQPCYREKMYAVWRKMLPVIPLNIWGGYRQYQFYPDLYFRMTDGKQYSFGQLDSEMMEVYRFKYNELLEHLPALEEAASMLAEFDFDALDDFQRRDILDIARTIFSRLMIYAIAETALTFEQWRGGTAIAYKPEWPSTPEAVCAALERMKKLGHILTQILEASEDFSLGISLQKLRAKHETNPDFELTLKGNAENGYCRSFIYELSLELYEPSIRVVEQFLTSRLKDNDRTPVIGFTPYLAECSQQDVERFYATPLEQIAPDVPSARKRIPTVLKSFAELIAEYRSCQQQ